MNEAIKRMHSDSPFEKQIGYCRAIVAGGFVHVAGTVGDGETVEAQCADALEKIEKACLLYTSPSPRDA